MYGNDMPHFYAFLFMMVLQILNMSSIYFFLAIIDVSTNGFGIERIEFMIIGFGYFALNYLFLVFQGRHKKYVSRFEKESAQKAEKKDFWFNLYVLITIVTFVGCIVYMFMTVGSH